jgi:thiamine-monophosphate kinase
MFTRAAAARLDQLGERAILQDLVLPRFSRFRSAETGIGDDCAEIEEPPPGHVLVMTTDPCPRPLVFDVADRDYWHYGWMTMLINVSDLAAMGAQPVGIVVSTVMPNDMPVSDYERFLDGLVAGAEEWGCPVLGGNIKDGDSFTATGTAIGSVRKDRVMRRVGAAPGHLIYVIGEMGLFWAALLGHLFPDRLSVTGRASRRLRDALHRPVARLREGRVLGDAGVVSACMDASDGVSGCLRELAVRNSVDFVLDGAALTPSDPVAQVADALGVDPRRLLLSWGNWELVITVPPDRSAEFQRLALRHGIQHQFIGQVAEGTGYVLLYEDGRARRLTNFASERFSPTSYFTHGIESYAQWLLHEPLFESDPL